LHDAGETKAMQPVMNALEQERVNYSILADATAATLLRGNPHLVKLPAGVSSPSDMVSLANALPVGGMPSLPKAQAIACLQQLRSSRCVITGLVSEFQKAWASFFKQGNQPVIGYYNGFHCNPNDTIAENFLDSRSPSKLDVLMTPSEDTANFFRRRVQELNPAQPVTPIFAMGQPVLEATSKAIQATDPTALAARLGINLQKPTILFVGGYGPHYPEAFRLFCQTMRQFANANVLVALHPKASGALEARLLAENPMPNPIKLVPRDIDATQLLALSPVVLAQDSTFVTQAVLQGQKATFIGEPVSNAPGGFNPLVAKGVVSREKDPARLAAFIQQAITSRTFYNTAANQPVNRSPTDLATLQSYLGIPPQATRRIVAYLKAFLSPNASTTAQASA